MKLKFVAVAALVAFGSGAQANTTDWGMHAPLEFGVNFVSGSFTDWFQFTIAPNALTVASTAVANNLGNGIALNIANGKYSLWSYGTDNAFGSGAGDDVKLGGNWLFNGSSGNTTNAVLLAPGKYYYQIEGAGTGTFGGAYSLTSTTTPVPEPETYAMLLAGLGAIGFLARRRKNG